MEQRKLEYSRGEPVGHQEWPQASLALLLGVGSGPMAIGLLFCSAIRSWFALLAIVPLVGTVIYSAVILIRTVQARAPWRPRAEAIIGIVTPCLWPWIVYCLVRVSGLYRWPN